MSRVETANFNDCKTYRVESYGSMLDKDELRKILAAWLENNTYAIKFCTRGNPPTREFTIYPGALKISIDDFGVQINEFLGKEEPNVEEQATQLIKEINKLDKRLIKKAKNPTGFWETFLGAFADIFS